MQKRALWLCLVSGCWQTNNAFDRLNNRWTTSDFNSWVFLWCGKHIKHINWDEALIMVSVVVSSVPPGIRCLYLKVLFTGAEIRRNGRILKICIILKLQIAPFPAADKKAHWFPKHSPLHRQHQHFMLQLETNSSTDSLCQLILLDFVWGSGSWLEHVF